MYIETQITVEEIKFQRMTEDGIPFSDPDRYLVTDYRIELSPNQLNVYIQLLDAPTNLWPPKASYPVERMIFVDTTQVPAPLN